MGCLDTLRRIQNDCGISEKDLKKAVHNIATPEERKITEMSYIPDTQEVQYREEKKKLQKKAAKQQKYDIVYWYLEMYLKKRYAMKYYYEKYSTADEVIEHAYEDALQIIQLHTAVIDEEVSPEEVLAECFPTPPNKYDIPDSQWEAFGRYCKKHPLKKGETILDRRRKFMKTLRKVKRKYYSKKRLSAMYDPLFAHTVVSEKEMIKNLEEITEKNAMRIEEFHAFMESLCENNYISQDVMKKFDHQTKQMMDHHKRRLREFVKRTEHDDRTRAELDVLTTDPIDEMFDLELP